MAWYFCGVQLKRLPEPYDGGGCLDTLSEDFKNPLEFFYLYTYGGCELEFNDFLKEAWGCIPFTADGSTIRVVQTAMDATSGITMAFHVMIRMLQ